MWLIQLLIFIRVQFLNEIFFLNTLVVFQKLVLRFHQIFENIEIYIDHQF